jgi:hemoglobin
MRDLADGGPPPVRHHGITPVYWDREPGNEGHVPHTSQPQLAQPDLLARLGGVAGIAAAVEDFHCRLLSDPSLAPAFAGIDMEVLRRHHVELLAFLLGGEGPQPIGARGLRAAHEPHRITAEQFSTLVNHLVVAMVEQSGDRQAAPEVMRRLTWLRPHIVYDEIIRAHPAQTSSTDGVITDPATLERA